MLFVSLGCTGMVALPAEAQLVTAELVLHEQLPAVPGAKASHWQPQTDPLGRRNLLGPWLG